MDSSSSNRPLEVQTGGASATPPQNGANELAFGMLMNRVMGNSSSKRPSDKSANEVQVDIVLNQAASLGKMNDQYVETYVVKGTKALYDLLGAFYSYALQIDQSSLRDNIIQRMAERLDSELDVKTQANTPWLTTVTRFILPQDRQTAFNYSRVLQIAFEENLAASELPAYIKERGGISKMQGTKEEAVAAKAVKTHKEDKVKMLKKVLMAEAKATPLSSTVPENKVLNICPEGAEVGKFEYSIALRVGDENRIIHFLQIPQALEEQILKAISEVTIQDDLGKVQGQLDDFRASLGITSGWGMMPGDKGFQLPGVPVLDGAEGQAVSSEALQEAPF